jgi:hypothetical protein
MRELRIKNTHIYYTMFDFSAAAVNSLKSQLSLYHLSVITIVANNVSILIIEDGEKIENASGGKFCGLIPNRHAIFDSCLPSTLTSTRLYYLTLSIYFSLYFFQS